MSGWIAKRSTAIALAPAPKVTTPSAMETKARPGPLAPAISATVRPVRLARLPRMEKMAKPPVRLKAELARATNRQTRKVSSLGAV